MSAKNIISKLSSRKFWAAVSGVVIAVMAAFGADADTQTTVAGVISAVAVLAVYIFTEGKIDEAAVNGKEEENDDEN